MRVRFPHSALTRHEPQMELPVKIIAMLLIALVGFLASTINRSLRQW